MLDEESLSNVWQLGTHQGVRIICLYHSSIKTMFPLFVDYHHLVHPSSWHNESDYAKNSFCPHSTYSKQQLVK